MRCRVLVGLILGVMAASSCEKRTEWDGEFAEAVARPEHPRPDSRRETFINLNTKWDFAYDPGDVGVQERWFEREDVWTHKIQVPFAWESPLSGLVEPHEGPYSLFDTVRATTYRGVAWYRLRLPGALRSERGMDWHVVFGAVDFETTVWINGNRAATHTGGYDPFSANLSDAAGGEAAVIVLRVVDRTELNDYVQPVGKQGGTWYTRTSGIWQTVYLEQRPRTYVDSFRVVPRPSESRAEIRVRLSEAGSGTLNVRATLEGEVVGRASATIDQQSEVDLSLPLVAVQLWDVDHPVLYDLDVEFEERGIVRDVVHSYFGMVEVGTDWVPGHSPAETPALLQQYKSLTVNGRPRYLRCFLDQSFYSDGIYTAPSIEAIRRDLEIAKSFGFNCIRLHIKSDEPVKYRLMDEMGFYVVYDFVALDLSAKNVEGFAGRKNFEHAMREAIRRDANHPSIVAWVVFNENWGLIENGAVLNPVPLANSPSVQKWVQAMVGLAKSLDPTRPVEDNSAGGVVQRFEHLGTDLNSFHYYGDDPLSFRSFLEVQAAMVYPGSPESFVGGSVQDGDPWWSSEFASFSTLGAPEVPKIFCDLFGLVNELRRQPKLVGWVLTQLTDVEYELNGLVNYDRTPKPDLCTRAGVGLQDILGDDFVGFEIDPAIEWSAGESRSVPIWFSQWSSSEPKRRVARVGWEEGPAQDLGFESRPFENLSVGTFELIAPAVGGDHRLVAEVVDPDGKRICANRVDVNVVQLSTTATRRRTVE